MEVCPQDSQELQQTPGEITSEVVQLEGQLYLEMNEANVDEMSASLQNQCLMRISLTCKGQMRNQEMKMAKTV
jgi:hypothetical protein